MRAVVQRVSWAAVAVDGHRVGEIGPGLAVLVGVAGGDGPDAASRLADKVANLRILPDGDGRMNRSVRETAGEVLVVSQFTLCADTSRGRRPSFVDAADPAIAEPLIEAVVAGLRGAGLTVETGRFGADMQVELCNDGPVTLVLDV